LSYRGLGNRDLADAKILLKHGGSPSAAGRLIQQAVEKHLKQAIEESGNINLLPLLKVHNTIKLYDRVVELGLLKLNKDDRKMMSVIKDYYYDLNYPGENNMELTLEEAEEAWAFAERVINELVKLDE